MVRSLLAFLLLISSHLYASYDERGPVENVGGFIAGTMVHTFTGPDTIQNIRVNDRLLSFDPESGEIVHSRVTNVYKFQVDQLARLVIAGEEFYLNPDHRFYIPATKEWVAARNLEPGTHVLMNKNGDHLKVDEKELIDGREWIYDLSVEDTENYFVGDNQVLVHNFVFLIPVATWVIGEGLVWASAATIAVAVGAAIVSNEISKNSSHRPDSIIEVPNFEKTKADPTTHVEDLKGDGGGGGDKGRPLPRLPITERKQRNKPSAPDPLAEGRPHTRIERLGRDGQYTTHYGDGTYKQYRGSGKEHGSIARPNVKENKLNIDKKTGRTFPGKGEVRPANPEEIPNG